MAGDHTDTTLPLQLCLDVRPVDIPPARSQKPRSELEREHAVQGASIVALLAALERPAPAFFTFARTARPTVVLMLGPGRQQEEFQGYCPRCQSGPTNGPDGPAVVIRDARGWFCFRCRRIGTRAELVDMVLHNGAATDRLIAMFWPEARA